MLIKATDFIFAQDLLRHWRNTIVKAAASYITACCQQSKNIQQNTRACIPPASTAVQKEN